MELYRLQLRITQNKPEVISCIRILNQFSARNIFRKSGNEFWLIDKQLKYIYLFNSSNGLFKIVADISGLPLKGGILTINEFNNEIVIGLATTGLFYYDILQKSWVQMQNPDIFQLTETKLERIARITGHHPCKCLKCKTGTMQVVEILLRIRSPDNVFYPRIAKQNL